MWIIWTPCACFSSCCKGSGRAKQRRKAEYDTKGTAGWRACPIRQWWTACRRNAPGAQRACWEFNRLPPDARAERTALLRGLFGRTGEHLHIEEPFHCDLGYNIEVGEWFYANYNCVILDVCRVTIGDNVMFAPNVAIYAAGPSGTPGRAQFGLRVRPAVAIGNNVWLGGNTVVTPGVTIGDNVVVGAGSVVTRDIPANVVAAGNPCRVLRAITEADADYYFKDRKFDVDWHAEL